MNPALGVATLVISLGVVGVAAWFVRPRAGTTPFVLTLVVAGAGLGVGALLCMEGVGTVSWFLTPTVVAVLTVAHTMAMVADDGPLRT